MKRWKIDEADYLPLAVIEDTEEGHGVAEIGLNGERTPANIANAKLIAAAPELLEACKEALDLFKGRFPEEHGSEDIGLVWGKVQEAINKVEE